MHYRDYAMSRAGEWVLLALLSGALAYLMLGAFNASSSLASPVLAAGVPAAVLAVALGAVSFSRRSRMVGYPVIAVVAIVAFAAVVLAGQGGPVLADVAGNLVVAALVAVACGVVCFVLSRWRAGCVVLALGALLLSCFVEVLYQEHHWVAYLVLCVSALAMLAMRWFTVLAERNGTGTSNWTAVAVQTLGLAVVAVAAGCALWAAVILPLQPPVIRPILNTEHVAIENEYVQGVSNEVQETNPSDTSNTFTDATVESSTLGSATDSDSQTMTQTQEGEGVDSPVQGVAAGLEEEGDDELEAVAEPETPAWLWLLVPLAVVLVVCVLIAVRLLLRRRRLFRMMEGDPAEAVQTVYAQTLANLGRLGYALPNGMTPLEFAGFSEELREAFPASDVVAGFEELTQVFAAAAYGGAQVDDGQLARIAAFSKNFYAQARKLVGTPKYLLKWLRIK